MLFNRFNPLTPTVLLLLSDCRYVKRASKLSHKLVWSCMQQTLGLSVLVV